MILAHVNIHSHRISGTRQPFNIRFLSDMYDLAAEAKTIDPGTPLASPKGFKLCYIQDAKFC
jgi:hypothetical protein